MSNKTPIVEWLESERLSHKKIMIETLGRFNLAYKRRDFGIIGTQWCRKSTLFRCINFLGKTY